MTEKDIDYYAKVSFYELNETLSAKDKANLINKLATELQAERAKVKDDVWENCPEKAATAIIYFHDANKVFLLERKLTRPLPKTLEQEIAEKYDASYDGAQSIKSVVELALKEYAARTKLKE